MRVSTTRESGLWQNGQCTPQRYTLPPRSVSVTKAPSGWERRRVDRAAAHRAHRSVARCRRRPPRGAFSVNALGQRPHRFSPDDRLRDRRTVVGARLKSHTECPGTHRQGERGDCSRYQASPRGTLPPPGGDGNTQEGGIIAALRREAAPRRGRGGDVTNRRQGGVLHGTKRRAARRERDGVLRSDGNTHEEPPRQLNRTPVRRTHVR